MSKHRVVVLEIVAGPLGVSQAAEQYQMSRQYLHRLLARYRAEGLAGLEPRSRRPRTNPATTSENVRARIVELRRVLTGSGLDAGPAKIGWHLEQEQIRPPAISTIRRILHAAGLVTAQPRKRPKTSYVRFGQKGTGWAIASHAKIAPLPTTVAQNTT
jgi:transposase